MDEGMYMSRLTYLPLSDISTLEVSLKMRELLSDARSISIDADY